MDKDIKKTFHLGYFMLKMVTILLLGLICITTTALFAHTLPYNTIEFGITVSIKGLIMLAISSGAAYFACSEINKQKPKYGIINSALLTTPIYAIYFSFFRILYFLNTSRRGIHPGHLRIEEILIQALFFALLGFLISNIFIRKIRNLRIDRALLLLISLFVLFVVSINVLS